jgi:cytochrome c oxidase accessory protein FixG
VERLLEGDAPARRALDRAPWTAEKLLRRGTKWAAFGLLSLAIAHVFISYFVSLPELYSMMKHSPLENWGAFVFVFAMAGALLFDFAWFREQFCIVMCPYGRLQSALIDDDSVVIGYDKKRGEPRGKVHTEGVGDCVDCRRCVQVCPTGIDIRQGMQIECISCANCIDACDTVMVKLNRPRGLIRYASTHSLAGTKTRFIRGRTILYTALLMIGAVVMLLSLSTLKPATVTVTRMLGAPFYMSGGTIRNQYLFRINNKRNAPVHFTVKLKSNIPDIKASGAENGIDVAPLGEQIRPIVVVVPAASYKDSFQAEFEVTADTFSATTSAPFLGPDVTPE